MRCAVWCAAVWSAALVLRADAASAPSFPNDRTLSTSHFILRHESAFAPAGVLNTLEALHAKLLLDLGAFSGWAYTEKIPVFLYASADDYHAATGLPAWSGGHVNLATRTIHTYESDAFQRVMAHELAHLFFTRFFAEKSAEPPLWLNEGVATLMEWDYGLATAAPRIDRELALDETPLTSMFVASYDHVGDGSSAAVGRWYAQCASVTRFLMRRFSAAQFTRFCVALRDGKSLDDALRAGYDLAVPDVATLETLWRQSL